MNSEELEKKVKSLEERIRIFEDLEEKVRTLEDIEQIKILQRAYGYYAGNMMPDDMADLFTEEGTFRLGGRICIGQKSIRNYLRRTMHKRPEDSTKKLDLHMQLQGVVHIEQGGQTAKGRWQMLSLTTDYIGKPPGELQPIIGTGIYEMEYTKENGIWKIKKLNYDGSFSCTLQDGWVKATNVERTYAHLRAEVDQTINIGDTTWPSGYKVPCHFKNPVTGR